MPFLRNRKIRKRPAREMIVSDVVAVQQAMLNARVDPERIDVWDRQLYRGLEVTDAQIDEGWLRLAAHINCNRRAHRARLRVAVALSCLLLLGGATLAAGILPWKLIVDWDENRVRIVVTPVSETREQSVYYPDVLGAGFIAALEEHGMRVALPAWLPDGFLFDEAVVNVSEEDWTQLVAFYQNNDRTLLITVDRYSDLDGTLTYDHEKDAETMIVHDAEYLVYENLGRLCAQWQRPPYAVSITGDITKDDLLNIIDSIEQEEKS